MRWISFVIILLAATLLEAGNLLSLEIGGLAIRPSILITMLVFYTFQCRPRDAIICSFAIGFAADLSTELMGPHMICFGLLGLLLNQSNQVLYAQRVIYKAIIVFVSYFVAETFSYWLGLLKDYHPQGNYYSVLLFTAVYSTVISPIIWSILSSLSKGFVQSKQTDRRVYH